MPAGRLPENAESADGRHGLLRRTGFKLAVTPAGETLHGQSQFQSMRQQGWSARLGGLQMFQALLDLLDQSAIKRLDRRFGRRGSQLHGGQASVMQPSDW